MPKGARQKNALQPADTKDSQDLCIMSAEDTS